MAKIKIKIKKDSTSVTRFGEVPTKKIDSMNKANPKLGRAIGIPYIGTGGKKTYGPDASDAIKSGLSPRKGKAT